MVMASALIVFFIMHLAAGAVAGNWSEQQWE
jgi:hypothetical protein